MTRKEFMYQKKETQWLVFTDLDGSLLDHFTYQFDEAIQSLETLAKQNIPVIPISSKTQAELQQLRDELRNNHPFIIENGAAVFIPLGYFKEQPLDTKEVDGYWVKSFVKPREDWQQLILNFRSHYEGKFITFDEAGIAGIIEMTGLNKDQARKAAKRQYSEPLSWQGNCNDKTEFIKDLERMSANVLEGGRFLHVSGKCDKGTAFNWLKNIYQTQEPEQAITTLALGDSGNDVAMLEIADFAALIKSPVHELPILQREEGLFITTSTGPKGWSEGVSHFIYTD